MGRVWADCKASPPPPGPAWADRAGAVPPPGLRGPTAQAQPPPGFGGAGAVSARRPRPRAASGAAARYLPGAGGAGVAGEAGGAGGAGRQGLPGNSAAGRAHAGRVIAGCGPTGQFLQVRAGARRLSAAEPEGAWALPGRRPSRRGAPGGSACALGALGPGVSGDKVQPCAGARDRSLTCGRRGPSSGRPRAAGPSSLSVSVSDTQFPNSR